MSKTVKPSKCLTLDLESYEEFVDAVREDPDQGKISFSARTEWSEGARTKTEARDWDIPADEPQVLGGGDTAPDPVELLLASLTSCLSIGLVTKAAQRDIDLEDFEIEIEGDLDLRGYFGLDESIRPGYTRIQYTLRAKSDADPEQLRTLLSDVENASPMFDNIRHGVPIESELEIVS